jgi:hypothetical protein
VHRPGRERDGPCGPRPGRRPGPARARSCSRPQPASTSSTPTCRRRAASAAVGGRPSSTNSRYTTCAAPAGAGCRRPPTVAPSLWRTGTKSTLAGTHGSPDHRAERAATGPPTVGTCTG